MGARVIDWHSSDIDGVAKPDAVRLMLERGIAASPGNAVLSVKLGNLHLSAFDFARAAAAFETALRLEPARTEARARLARCWNRLERYKDVLDLIAENPGDHTLDLDFQGAVAAVGLGRLDAAERGFLAVLDRDPHHRHAAFELGRLLRQAGRFAALSDLCETLAAKGVRHAQLLLDWGRSAAHIGRVDWARRLLLDPDRIVRTTLETPERFDSLAAFNAALARELLGNPYAMTDVPRDELAMRGASRIHHLMNGQRPDLIRTLLDAIRDRIDTLVDEQLQAACAEDDDPWLEGRPARAQLQAWGLIQKRGDYEAWHTHRGGWLSGVYYIQIPAAFSIEGQGDGCIEFGVPPSLAEADPEAFEPLRIPPEAGMLLLTPSHYHHRTIPFDADGQRICLAFDVCPM